MISIWKKRSFGSLRQWSAADFCGRLDLPGDGTEDPALVDYSARPVTPDQSAIEELLASRDLSGRRLLHVGVGDSSLAARLIDRCGSIDGITVSDGELRHGESLGLAGYRVFWVNKYTRDFCLSLRPGYAFIVDQNPGSFACCAYHFAQMMDNYRWALAPGGELLAHQRGLRWVAEDRRWRMTFDDLAEVGRRFGMSAHRYDDGVYSLRRD